MAFVGTLGTGLHLFASLVNPRASRSRATSLRAASAAQGGPRLTSIDQELAGRSGDGLAMRWFADDASLRATWERPQLAG